jgi:hypothetical protein
VDDETLQKAASRRKTLVLTTAHPVKGLPWETRISGSIHAHP